MRIDCSNRSWENRKYNIFDILFFIIMVLLMQCFNLIHNPTISRITSNQQEILVLVFICIYLFARKKIIVQKKDGFSKMILFFIVFYFGEVIYSWNRYNQSLLDVLVASNFYLTILFYFVILDYVQLRGREKVYKLIIAVSFISVCICWIQFFLAQYFGIIFMNALSQKGRFGTIRIPVMGLAINNIGIIIAIALLINGSKLINRKFLVFYSIIGTLGMLIVSKGRLQLLALFLSIVVVILVRFRHDKRIVGAVLFIAVAFILLALTPIGKKYLNSFSNSETDTYSVRLREAQYYLNMMKDNVITGTGFIRDDSGGTYTRLLRGDRLSYSRSDIGILGVANAIGIVGAGWYLLVTLKLFKSLLAIKKEEMQSDYLILLGVFMFSVFTIPTVILFNAYGVTVFAMIMGLIYSAHSDFQRLR